MKITKTATEVIENVLTLFDTPEKFIDTVTRGALIPNNSPCRNWSPSNRFVVAMSGTGDARGYKQWMKEGRTVIKGSKASYILVPMIIKRDDEDTGEVKTFTVGFRGVPVFRVEDTDGKPLPNIEPETLPKAFDIAKQIGVTCKYAGATSDRVYGVYSGASKGITLYSQDMATFYHELAHALHDRLGKLRKTQGQSKENEIVAELSAAVLVNIFEGETASRQALEYVKSYKATKNNIISLTKEIMEVVDLAITIGRDLSPQIDEAV